MELERDNVTGCTLSAMRVQTSINAFSFNSFWGEVFVGPATKFVNIKWHLARLSDLTTRIKDTLFNYYLFICLSGALPDGTLLNFARNIWKHDCQLCKETNLLVVYHSYMYFITHFNFY